MDKASKGDTTRDRAQARRKRMQSHARGLRPNARLQDDGFATPEWLDRSFVLPLTRPEMSDVPSQSMPDHDNFSEPLLHDGSEPETGAQPAPAFVRPPSRDIDFALVIKRADRCRAATRTAAASTAIACLALVAYLLTASPIFLSITVLGAVGGLASVVVRLSLSSAAIPHLKR